MTFRLNPSGDAAPGSSVARERRSAVITSIILATLGIIFAWRIPLKQENTIVVRLMVTAVALLIFGTIAHLSMKGALDDHP